MAHNSPESGSLTHSLHMLRLPTPILWDGGPDEVCPSPFCLFIPMGPRIPSPFGSSFPLDPSFLFPFAYVQHLWLFEHLHPCLLFVLFVSSASLSLSAIFPWREKVGAVLLAAGTPTPELGLQGAERVGTWDWLCSGRSRSLKCPEELQQRGDGEQWGQWLLQGPRNTLGATGNSFQNTEKSVLFKCAAV